MKNCPSCCRELTQLTDYPRILVVNFERLDMPKNTKFPFSDHSIYVRKGSSSANKNPPDAVVDFFDKNKETKSFSYKGWEWNRDRNWYNRHQSDQSGIISSAINPYLDGLLKKIGKEVEQTEFLPKFKRDGYIKSFNIPGTGYSCDFWEKDKKETPSIAEFHLLGPGPNMGSAGGPTLQSYGLVGKLEYEGRLIIR